MVKIAIKSLCLITLFFLLCGCTEKEETKKVDEPNEEVIDEKLPEGLTPEQAAKVVAKVGELEITVGEVTEQINRLSPYIRRRWATPEKRKEFLQKLIRVELLSQEANRQGLANDPEVVRTVKQVMIRLMVQNDLEKEILPTSVDENILKEEYEKDHDKYHRPAQIRASHIVLKSESEAMELIADISQHSSERKYFREKAKELSIDTETKGRGGDLGYFSNPVEAKDAKQDAKKESTIDKMVAQAAWTIEKVGTVFDKPIKSQEGYHVVKLTNKKPEMNRSFESVKRLIENQLLRQLRRDKMDEFIAQLKEKAKIEINEDNLAQIKLVIPESKDPRDSSITAPKQSPASKNVKAATDLAKDVKEK